MGLSRKSVAHCTGDGGMGVAKKGEGWTKKDGPQALSECSAHEQWTKAAHKGSANEPCTSEQGQCARAVHNRSAQRPWKGLRPLRTASDCGSLIAVRGHGRCGGSPDAVFQGTNNTYYSAGALLRSRSSERPARRSGQRAQIPVARLRGDHTFRSPQRRAHCDISLHCGQP